MIGWLWEHLLQLDDRRRRWMCRKFGHRIIQHGVDGMLEFPHCLRCRKFGRQVVQGEIVS